MARKGAQRGGQDGSADPGSPGDPGAPFADKVGDIVAKVVPEHLLAIVFAGTAVLALVLLVLAIVGFARDPGEVAKGNIESLSAEIAEAQKALKEEQVAHAKTRDERKALERKAGSSEGEVAKALASVTRLETERSDLKTQMEKLREELKVARGEISDLAREVKTVEKQAKGALGELESANARLKKAELDITAWKEKYEATRQEKSKADETYERAELAYKTIVEAVKGIDTPDKKIETVEKMRTSEAAMQALQGSVFAKKLDDLIAVEWKNARREAQATYRDCMDKLEMTVDHGAALELLAEAKKDFDDRGETAYALKVHKATEDRKDQIAREVQAEVMKTVLAEPEAYEANIARLKEALEKVKGTRWSEAIEAEIARREQTLPDDIARMRYEELVSKSRLNPDDHDANIAYAEEVKSKITKRYEAKYAKQVAALERARTEAKGRKAVSEALELIAKDPENYQANIERIGGLLKDAEGSGSAAKLEKLLQRERAMLARAKK